MLVSLLKALELLISTLKLANTADKKREKLAKELFRIYLGNMDVISRGRQIISLIETKGNYALERLPSLLIQQEHALEDLCDRLTSGIALDVLRLENPTLISSFSGLLGTKAQVIWRLQRAGHLSALLISELQLPPDEEPDNRISDVTGRMDPLSRLRVEDHFVDEEDFDSLNNRTVGIARAAEVLDQLASENEILRAILLEKFKLEDFL